MTSNESGNLWFLQQGADSKLNQQTPPPTYQSPNPTNPFNKPTQSPPPQDGSVYSSLQPGYAQQPYPQQQGSPYPQQQGGSFPPQQHASQPGTPYSQQQGSPYPQQAFTSPQQQGSYPPQQNVYSQPGAYTPQQGYPQSQGSPYPQQAYPQQRQSSDPNSQVGGEATSFYGSGSPPVVQPGGGPGDRGLFDSAIQIAGVQQPPPGPDGLERGWFSSSKNPLDPPPKMFKRPAPGHYAYINFRPVSVLAVSDKLQDGFALIPPVTAPGDPHPFTSHDITEEDWHKFLKDFQKTAHLSASDRLFQGMSNSFAKDKKSSANVQKRVAENKLEPIGDYLMAWNHYFFHPRRMSVVLAKGGHRFSGETDDPPPDVGRHTKKASKEKKSQHGTRSADVPLVTVAEPYPRGSLIGGLLNPVHKAIHETSVAIVRAPNDLLYGVQRGDASRSRGRDSDSDDSTSSSDSDDRRARHGKRPKERRAERGYRREERRDEREARKEERRRRREQKYGKAPVKESVVDIQVPSGRFRLVLCYWDGQREVF